MRQWEPEDRQIIEEMIDGLANPISTGWHLECWDSFRRWLANRYEAVDLLDEPPDLTMREFVGRLQNRWADEEIYTDIGEVAAARIKANAVEAAADLRFEQERERRYGSE